MSDTIIDPKPKKENNQHNGKSVKRSSSDFKNNEDTADFDINQYRNDSKDSDRESQASIHDRWNAFLAGSQSSEYEV